MKNKRCWIGIEDWKILEKVLIDYFPPFPYLSQECEICLKQHIVIFYVYFLDFVLLGGNGSKKSHTK